MDETPLAMDVELWLLDLETCRSALDALEGMEPRLSDDDLAKVAASPEGPQRAARRAAHIALRILIERMFGARWRRVPYVLSGTGKPELQGLVGSFNLAHVERDGLVGLSRRRRIGVDLEPDRAPHVSDERRHAIEAAAIELARGAALPEAPRDRRFLQAWVRLEAVAKADAQGIGRLLTSLGIIGDGAIDSRAAAQAIGSRIHVEDVASDGTCVAAVAVVGEVHCPPPRRLPADVAGLERLLGR